MLLEDVLLYMSETIYDPVSSFAGAGVPPHGMGGGRDHGGAYLYAHCPWYIRECYTLHSTRGEGMIMVWNVFLVCSLCYIVGGPPSVRATGADILYIPYMLQYP